MQCVWKDIPGWEGKFQCSDSGLVRSLDRKVVYNDENFPGISRVAVFKGKVRLQNKRGQYLVVGLQFETFKKTFLVHRLVAMTFKKNPKGLLYVNHENGIKTDNRALNVNWCTSGENQLHALDTGLKRFAVRNKVSKSDVDFILLSLKKRSHTAKQLALLLGVTPTAIYHIRRGLTWGRHTGINKPKE